MYIYIHIYIYIYICVYIYMYIYMAHPDCFRGQLFFRNLSRGLLERGLCDAQGRENIM